MTATPNATPTATPSAAVLDSWLQEGVLTADEVARARSHAQHAQLAATSDRVGVLVWLVRHGILTEDILAARGAAMPANTGDKPGRADAAQAAVESPVDVALCVLEQLGKRPGFGTLMAQGIVTQAECIVALLHCDESERDFPTPGAALAWMIVNRFVSAEREAEIFKQDKTTSSERAALLAEATRVLARFRTTLDGPASGMAEWGMHALKLLGVALLLGLFALAWMLFARTDDAAQAPPAPAATEPRVASGPIALPGCADPQVARDIVTEVSRPRNPEEIYGRRVYGDQAPAVKLDAIVEVGQSTRPLMRGCRAQLTVAGAGRPYGFIVSLDAERRRFSVAADVDPAILEARFAKLGAGGGFLHNAEPVGREAVMHALQGGFAAMRKMGDMDMNTPMPGPDGLISTMGERVTPKVLEVEPLAPCTQDAEDGMVRCRLLISVLDPLWKDRKPGRLEGEFSFTRSGEGAPWSVSDRFVAEISNATLGSLEPGNTFREAVPWPR